MTFPKEQIWNLYRKLRIGFEEIRKYAFAYINTVRQGLQGIFSETLVNKYLTSNLTKSSRSPAGVAKSNSSGWGPFTNCFPVR